MWLYFEFVASWMALLWLDRDVWKMMSPLRKPLPSAVMLLGVLHECGLVIWMTTSNAITAMKADRASAMGFFM
jgi:hypothetical protein